MKIKNGVRIIGINPELVLGLFIADSVYSKFGQELVITSVVDGKHSKYSRHYLGYAADLRIHYFAEDMIEAVAEALREALGDDFFVLVEKDHIHMSFKPKMITG